MIIKGKDFIMEQVKTSPFFNLKLTATINKGKSSEREDLKLVGYSMNFYNCIKTIIVSRLEKIDKICTVSEYIDLFEQEVNSFLNESEILLEDITLEESEELDELEESEEE